MPHFRFLWNDEIIQHLAEHGVSPEEFEQIVSHPSSKGWSRTTGLPVAWGYSRGGRYIMAVYEEMDALTLLPVTAYEVPEPR